MATGELALTRPTGEWKVHERKAWEGKKGGVKEGEGWPFLGPPRFMSDRRHCTEVNLDVAITHHGRQSVCNSAASKSDRHIHVCEGAQ